MMTKKEADKVAQKVRQMDCIAAFRRWPNGSYEVEARDKTTGYTFVVGSMDELMERLGPAED